MRSNLAAYLVVTDDVDGASAEAREAIGLLAVQAPRIDRELLVEQLALVAALQGDLARAAILEGYAETTIRRLGNRREATELRTSNEVAPLLLRDPARRITRLSAKATRSSPKPRSPSRSRAPSVSSADPSSTPALPSCPAGRSRSPSRISRAVRSAGSVMARRCKLPCAGTMP